MSQAGYNTGARTAFNILVKYLEQRAVADLPVRPEDFDFTAVSEVFDIDGEKRPLVDIARLNVMSSFVSPADKPEVKALKLKRRKLLPELWRNSFKKSFPEFLAYNANSFDGSTADYQVYGFPGYLNALTTRNRELRALLTDADFNPDLCSDPNFLKMKAQEQP